MKTSIGQSNIAYLRLFHVEKGWGIQHFDWPIPVVIKFIRCIFFLINLMKTSIGQSNIAYLRLFHVEKGWGIQHFDWPIPVVIKFIRCIFFLINLMKTGIGQWKYCLPQLFLRWKRLRYTIFRLANTSLHQTY